MEISDNYPTPGDWNEQSERAHHEHKGRSLSFTAHELQMMVATLLLALSLAFNDIKTRTHFIPSFVSGYFRAPREITKKPAALSPGKHDGGNSCTCSLAGRH